MSVLEVNPEHFSECDGGTELERNNQRPQESGGNLRTWINAQNDPFILKFPPEISSYIFCLSMDASSYELSKKLPTPFLLGSICHGWRLLAQSTPELWSILSFTLEKPTKPEGLSKLHAVSDWLKLSGAPPLTLRVFNYAGPDSFSQDGCDPVINILHQHSGRWHTLLLHLPAPLLGRFYGTSSPSVLCDLNILRYYSHDIDIVSPTFKMHSRPSPTHLTIWCPLSPISTFDIAWDNLTSLKLALTIFDGCIEVILKAPQLEFCSMDLIANGLFQNLPIPKTVVRHTHLRTLELTRFSAILPRFFDGLELPSLETYDYQTSLDDLEITMDAMISLLNRSGAHLKKLTFDIDGPCERPNLKLLDATPRLQHLHLEFYYSFSAPIIHDIFERLSSSPPLLEGNVPGFLPDLQTLTVSARGLSMWACIPRLFSWPHRKFLRLEVKRVDDKIEIDNDTLRKILRLVDDGASIRILGWNRDYLQQFKESSHEANLRWRLNR